MSRQGPPPPRSPGRHHRTISGREKPALSHLPTGQPPCSQVSAPRFRRSCAICGAGRGARLSRAETHEAKVSRAEGAWTLGGRGRTLLASGPLCPGCERAGSRRGKGATLPQARGVTSGAHPGCVGSPPAPVEFRGPCHEAPELTKTPVQRGGDPEGPHVLAGCSYGFLETRAGPTGQPWGWDPGRSGGRARNGQPGPRGGQVTREPVTR